MSFWAFYFLAKTALHFTGHLHMQWLPNLLLAIWVFWPVRKPHWLRLRTLAGIVCAVLLLYAESGLPSLERAFSQAHLLAGFSTRYTLELIGRLVSWQLLLGLAAALAVYVLLSARIRFATFAILGILGVGLQAAWQTTQQPRNGMAAAAASVPMGTGGPAGNTTLTPDSMLTAFFDREQQRKVVLQHPASAFDVVVLHVCSLAWDDMTHVGLAEHPFMTQAQMVFSQFNSASSYSGPASLRLLHGMCGQATHEGLYQGLDRSCYVFPALEGVGYQAQGLLNHDGVYDNFAKELEERGGLGGKLQSNQGAPAAYRSFDNSTIFSDYGTLHQWLEKRKALDSQAPVALYYNSITLHDGVHAPDASASNSIATYKPRLQQLLDDFARFTQELNASGRPTVLIMLPEHGANLRGDSMQIPGMREIPTPRITLVPTLVYLLNTPNPPEPQVRVDKPVSYVDLFTLLNGMFQNSPFQAGSPSLEARSQAMAGTDFVTDNETVTMLRMPDQHYWMRSKDSTTWVPYQP